MGLKEWRCELVVANYRTEQVETLLKGQDAPQQEKSAPAPAQTQAPRRSPIPSNSGGTSGRGFELPTPVPISMGLGTEQTVMVDDVGAQLPDMNFGSKTPDMGNVPDISNDTFNFNDVTAMNDISSDAFGWEMLAMGLDEPLPPQDTVDDLYVPSRSRSDHANNEQTSDIL